MNLCIARFVRPTVSALCAASLAAIAGCGGSVCIGFDGCTGAVVVQNLALAGTAATGKALASANLNVACAQGSGATLTDGGGRYSLAFNATPPCVMTVTSGGTTLHSLAFAGGTFNTTPETELMLVYLAAQLGTSVSSLIANFASNAPFQQALANQSNVLNAQSAVVANLQQHYAVTLAAPAFLTTPFTVGQAGVDSDLDALAKAGAIDANGMPDSAAVALMAQAGAAHPLAKASAPLPGGM
ncbi:hypothetical protein [Paraburkholderia sp. XV]|uniref:hypothetical protein n=1 Tax=Paraburkholderia sp. XV TaxID=2831520 RepID=UPI001CD6DAAA|nr:hypothetical protein [Paraburkholderia sp. XV]